MGEVILPMVNIHNQTRPEIRQIFANKKGPFQKDYSLVNDCNLDSYQLAPDSSSKNVPLNFEKLQVWVAIPVRSHLKLEPKWE